MQKYKPKEKLFAHCDISKTFLWDIELITKDKDKHSYMKINRNNLVRAPFIEAFVCDTSTNNQLFPNKNITVAEYKNCVLNELKILLNTTLRASTADLKNNYQYAFNSVIYYGIDGLAGSGCSNAASEKIINRINNAILKFEPRINPDSLKVKKTDLEGDANKIYFAIFGTLLLPKAVDERNVNLEISVDTGTGECSIIRLNGV